MGYPAFQAEPVSIGDWEMGRRGDAMKRPVRLANMEAISVLKDEKPASKAAILNLPGESGLGVDGTAGDTFPALFPPLPDSPLGPFVVEEDFLTVCWCSHSSTYPGRGGNSEGRDCPYSTNEAGTCCIQDVDLILT